MFKLRVSANQLLLPECIHPKTAGWTADEYTARCYTYPMNDDYWFQKHPRPSANTQMVEPWLLWQLSPTRCPLHGLEECPVRTRPSPPSLLTFTHRHCTIIQYTSASATKRVTPEGGGTCGESRAVSVDLSRSGQWLPTPNCVPHLVCHSELPQHVLHGQAIGNGGVETCAYDSSNQENKHEGLEPCIAHIEHEAPLTSSKERWRIRASSMSGAAAEESCSCGLDSRGSGTCGSDRGVTRPLLPNVTRIFFIHDNSVLAVASKFLPSFSTGYQWIHGRTGASLLQKGY